ncbi:MAG TPA: amidohydrolase family protein, partial [Thermomicrobiales bacterium]|nr:amidohydrolase family protein [Thermomicrobiales bacterium]
MVAELIVENAHIRTLDPTQPTATHIAIEHGTIVAVGGAEDVRPFHGSATRLIDGKDLAIVPGLTDSHFHPFWGTVATHGADLTQAKTLDDLRTILRREREMVGPDGWVVGWGLTFEMFQKTGIRGDTFAEAAGGGLAYLRFFDGHTSVASPAALAFCDVSGRETFVDFSTVVVDEHGVPTGELREGGAQALVTRNIPEPTEVEMYGWYLAEMKKWAAMGLTGIHNMDGTLETYDLLRHMEEKGDLSLRMIVPLWQQPEHSFEQMHALLPHRDDHGTLWRGGVAKFFIDGVIESGTAWLTEPDTKGMCTEPFWADPARYQEAVRIFAQAGFQCATHAVGDMAVRCALDAYEKAGTPEGLHHRIEHIELLTDQDLPRFAQLGVGASMQPLHMNAFEADGSDEWSVRVGPERRKRAFRTRDLIA